MRSRVLAALCCLLGLAGGAGAGELPEDAALEAAGARIGAITIRNEPIFNLADPRESGWLYRNANRLHVNTRAGVIRSQLLFRSGDAYSRRILDETERNLRTLRFLREPRIRPVAWHDGLVDVEVDTHDVWTIGIGPSYGRSGGEGRSSVEFSDANFLGSGKTLVLGASRSVDRRSGFYEWRDPAVWGSRWHDDLRYADNSDGRSWLVQVWHPFYSLSTRHAGGIDLEQLGENVTRYRLGEKYDSYLHHERTADLWLGWSPGREGAHAWRLTGGWHVARDEFAPPVEAGTALLGPLPADRDLEYPYLRWDWIPDQYRTTRNQDRIARTEDLQYGLALRALAGYAARSLGADRAAWIYSLGASYRAQLSAASQVYFAGSLDGRLEHGERVDERAGAEFSWYLRHSRRYTSYVHLAGDAGRALDLDHYFLLGGDTGLRGYPLRYQEGTGRALLRLEERLYTDWSLWRLLDIGAAAFFDAGKAFGTGPLGTPQLGWLKDVGLGLRLGNNHSSLGDVIHVDIARPLDGSGLRSLQFDIGTEASF